MPGQDRTGPLFDESTTPSTPKTEAEEEEIMGALNKTVIFKDLTPALKHRVRTGCRSPRGSPRAALAFSVPSALTSLWAGGANCRPSSVEPHTRLLHSKLTGHRGIRSPWIQ